MKGCEKTIDALVAYWLGELPAGEAEALEEHFFACAHCCGRLEWLAALAEGTRAVLRAGKVGLVVSAPFVEALRGAGFRLREYALAPGGSANCTIHADEHAVVSRIRAPLAGVARLDAVWRRETGSEAGEVRLEDVPFDAAAGEVLFIPSAAELKKMPAHRQRLRLVAVGEAGEAALGEYTFNHSPQ